MINTPYQFKSLASRVRGMHGALDADELAKLLGVAKVNILCRAKRGKIPSFRIGMMVRFDPQSISRWLFEQGIHSLASQKTASKFLIARIAEISGKSRSHPLNTSSGWVSLPVVLDWTSDLGA